MSIGFLLANPSDAVIWRGPKKTGIYYNLKIHLLTLIFRIIIIIITIIIIIKSLKYSFSIFVKMFIDFYYVIIMNKRSITIVSLL